MTCNSDAVGSYNLGKIYLSVVIYNKKKLAKVAAVFSNTYSGRILLYKRKKEERKNLRNHLSPISFIYISFFFFTFLYEDIPSNTLNLVLINNRDSSSL